MFNYRSFKNKVVVIPFAVEEIVGGIYIADSAKEKSIKATIVCAHPESGLTEGDIVIHNKHAGQIIEVDGEKYTLMSDDDIYFIEND